MKSNFSYLRILRTKPLLPWILKWLSCVIANEPQCHLIAAVKERNPGLIKWSCFWNYLFRTSGKAEIDQGWWKAMTKNNVSLLALHTSSIPNTNPPTLHSSPIITHVVWNCFPVQFKKPESYFCHWLAILVLGKFLGHSWLSFFVFIMSLLT